MENNKTDQDAIALALEDHYFKGIYEGNIDLLKGLFHADSLLFGDIKGEPYHKTIEEYLTGVADRQSPKDLGKPFEASIIAIKVVNSIAMAEVELKMYDFIYHDLLSFHRIDGKWLIVNKMLTDVNE
jgi:hypothetical protein